MSPTEPDWVPLGPDMLKRWVLLTRHLPDVQADSAAGYWAGPDHPGHYSDCLAQPSLRTGTGIVYAAVAAFTDPGTAWSYWTGCLKTVLGAGCVWEFVLLAEVADWTTIPPVRPRHFTGR
ncbi:hypothetical protein [Actinocatenispora comari]|uniref:hypothetical protein n=1 Tax=Actinocatenispora comari TaxID=2807577 RepID=UPI001A90D931|nr:hypothetical protein [Actinocatenispora comari]